MSNDRPESWLPFPGYEGYYEISSLGRARSLARMTRAGIRGGQLLKPQPNRGGYLTVNLSVEGRSKRRQIHQAVCEAWHGPRPHGLVTRHLDGDKLNNTPGNLRWGTYAENAQDMLRHGTNFCASKTRCPQGHPYDGDNLVLEGDSRKCRECRRDQSRRSYHANRDKEVASMRLRRENMTPEQREAKRASMRAFKERRKRRVAAERAAAGLPPPTRNADKTVCKRGHPLSGDNLYVTPAGKRQCRTCRRAEGRVRSAQRAAQVRKLGHPHAA